MSAIQLDSSSRRKPPIFALPNEIMAMVCGYLNAKGLIAMEKTCLLFRDIMENSDYLWKDKYFNEWGFLPVNCSFFFQHKHTWKVLFQTRHNLHELNFSSQLESYHLQEVDHAFFSEDSLHAIAKDEQAKFCLYKCDHADNMPQMIKKFSFSESILGFSGSFVVIKKNFTYLNKEKLFSIFLYPLQPINGSTEPIKLGNHFTHGTKVFITNRWVFTHQPNSNIVDGLYHAQSQKVNFGTPRGIEIGKTIRVQADIFHCGINEVQYKNGFIFFQMKRGGGISYVSEPHHADICNAQRIQVSSFSELNNCYIVGKYLYLFTFNFVFEAWDLVNCNRVLLKNLKDEFQVQGNEYLKLSDFDGQNVVFFTSKGRIIIYDPINQALLKEWYENLEIKFLKLIGENCLTADPQANIKLWLWNRAVPSGIWHVEKKCHDDEFDWMKFEDKIISFHFDGRYLKTLTQDGCYTVLDFLKS